MIKINKINFKYQTDHFNFTFDVKKEEHISIVGLSGAGKTTLLKLIAGFIPPISGKIYLDDQDHTSTDPSKRPISILFQENNLFDHLTIWQNIALGINTSLRLSDTQNEMLLKITNQMGLLPFLNRFPYQISGGQCQKVALARCLIRNKPILLLDEPFSSLDPALRQEMILLVKTLCEQNALTLVLISHHLDEISLLTNRSLVVNNHTIVFDGNTSDLLNGKTEFSDLLGIKNTK